MSTVPRINIELPDELHRKAKAAAALEGLSLKDYVVAAIERALKNGKPTGRR